MAKKVVRYLLEADGTVPISIEDGGYFQIGYELVGITVDAEKRHVPSTMVRLSRVDLINRVVSLNLKTFEGDPLSEQEKIDLVNSFLADRGLESYE